MMAGLEAGSGYTIFCDDIRTESGGKITLVGIYRQTIFVHGEFPFTLPKFGFSVAYFESYDDLPSEAAIQIFLPGDADNSPSVTSELKFAEGAKIATPTPAGEPKTLLGLHADLVLAPVVLKSEGAIKVRILRDQKEIKLGRLFVRKASPTTAPKPETLP